MQMRSTVRQAIAYNLLAFCCLISAPSDATEPILIANGPPVLAPFQHVRFCLRYPEDCKTATAADKRIKLTDETLGLLKRINRAVNASINPKEKSYLTRLEDGWVIGPNAGDCNDYAVTKRHLLVSAGIPANVLRLSVTKTNSGAGHLVLIVATDQGDLVLDNLVQTIVPWHYASYQWLTIQSESDPKFWYSVKVPTRAQISGRVKSARLAGLSSDQ